METPPPILDGENYRSTQQNFGFREICLKQVQRITNIYSKELTTGFYKKTQPGTYGNQEVVAYIPDGRLSYINAVECLYDLLLAKFDKDMEKDAKDINKEIDDGLEKAKEEKIIKDEWNNIKVILMRKMFQQLCMLLERLGWLEEESAGEE